MVAFWILATLMSLLAVAIVLVPLLRAGKVGGPSASEVALDVLRGQRQEIEHDIATGHLPGDARAEALAELVERAGEDVTPERLAAGNDDRKPWIAAGVLAIAIPALSFGVYSAIGTPSASDPKTLQAARAPQGEHEIAGMVENLASKVRERPDDAQGWALLARSYASMGRFPDAADAYERLAKLVPGDAQVLADWADALGMAQGRTLKGRPYELVREALKVDPKHRKALALAGTAAMDGGEFAAAVGYWQRLGAELPPDSSDAEQIRNIVAEVRSRAAAAGKPLPESPGVGPRVATAPPAAQPRIAPPPPAAQPATPGPGPRAAAPAGAAAVSGSVTVAPALAARVSGDETVFVFARAENGPRVPLAALRGRAGSLPIAFSFDDSQAMAPGMTISSTQSLRIEARISRSGNVTPQPGDLAGASAVIRPGTRDVKVVVDKVLP